MKTPLKSRLIETMNQWLAEQDASDYRPSGLACENLGEMMGEAASAVYDASHAGSVAGANDPSSCGVGD